jgi:hypothetical protein
VSYTSVSANQWYYVVGTFKPTGSFMQPWEQNMWVNATPVVSPYHASSSWGPDWGTADLRLGASSAGCCNLQGWLGGYIAIRHTMPSEAYIQASYANFIAKTFVQYGEVEYPPQH